MTPTEAYGVIHVGVLVILIVTLIALELNTHNKDNRVENEPVTKLRKLLSGEKD